MTANDEASMKLLHIDSSILGDASASRHLTKGAVERLRAGNPALEVTYRDVAAAPIAHLTRPADVDPDEDSTRALEEFLAADIVVIGVPMYNFAISSQLKAWVDRILVARRTFAYGPEGVSGLAGGKRIILAVTRGGFYGGETGRAEEYAESYLRAVFAFIGITDIQVLLAEGLLFNPAARDETLTRALASGSFAS